MTRKYNVQSLSEDFFVVYKPSTSIEIDLFRRLNTIDLEMML